MDYKTKRQLIIFSAIAVILLLIAMVAFGCRSEDADIVNIDPEIDEASALLTETEELEAEPEISEELKAPPVELTPPFSEVRRTAKIFTERYGTFSTLANYQNLRDVLYISSANLKPQLENTLAEKEKDIVDQENYFGLTTRVLSDAILSGSASDDEIVLLLQTQRDSSVGSVGNVETFYQEAKVKLIKENQIWKVDEITWMEKK